MSRTHRSPTGAPRREDVEGFLEGVTHRVAHAPPEHRVGWASALESGRQALQRADLVEAVRLLADLDRAIDESEGEPELSEFPRGLVAYVPLGDRGHPTPEDDEPIANRLRLVARLLDVRRSQGWDVAHAIAQLNEAEQAYRAGDRPSARRLGDAVHRELEQDGPSSPPREP